MPFSYITLCIKYIELFNLKYLCCIIVCLELVGTWIGLASAGKDCHLATVKFQVTKDIFLKEVNICHTRDIEYYQG